MTDIAIVGFAQTPTRLQSRGDEVELVQDVVSQARDRLGLRQDDIGFTCSGSSDFLSGRPFSFVSAVDGLGAWPPARESHVEMDGAWALFEAWVRLQHGDIDTALVYAFGQSSLGAIEKILTAQLEPIPRHRSRPMPTLLRACRPRPSCWQRERRKPTSPRW